MFTGDKNVMYNFIRSKRTRNLLHKLRGDSFHDKEMEVSGHQETKSSQGFYYPFISHETQRSVVFIFQSHCCSLPKEGFHPISVVLGSAPGWLARRGDTQKTFAHATAMLGQSSDLPSGQKPVDMSSLTPSTFGTMKVQCLSCIYQKMNEQA